MNSNIRTHELAKRLAFTALVLVIYIIGRNILLYGVDVSALEIADMDAQSIVVAMISGDRMRSTIMALGIMPSMTAGIIVSFTMILMSRDMRARISPQFMEKTTLFVTIVIAVLMAMMRMGEMVFREDIYFYQYAPYIAMAEMVIGAVLIARLAEMNRKKGIGGATPIIIFNIADNLVNTISSHTLSELWLPGIICFVFVIITLFMEKKILRIPVQRVSIHNAYADKSFIAFKYNTIGVMPAMFATAIFMLPQMIVSLLLVVRPEEPTLLMLSERLVLTDPLGVGVFLAIIYLITVLFSFVTLSPGEIADGLQKSGDSIVGVYAGKATVRYLRMKVFLLSSFSGIVIAAGMAVSLILALRGDINQSLALLPSTAMIFVGIGCALVDEISTHHKFDKYKFFV